jgi:hypothetical protein
VQATLWDNNIAAFKEDLKIGKTYLISNAPVKHTKVGYKNAYGDTQWTISGATRVEETNEDHSVQLFSTFQFTPFKEFESVMDTNKDLSTAYFLFFLFNFTKFLLLHLEVTLSLTKHEYLLKYLYLLLQMC